MKADWRDNKILLISLGVAVLGIWGYNVYQILNRLSVPEETPITSSSEMPNLRDAVAGSAWRPFDEEVRDPFWFPYKNQKGSHQPSSLPSTPIFGTPPPRTSPPINPEPIHLPLLVLLGTARNTAIIRNEVGEIRMSQVGDIVSGATLTAIATSSVQLRYQGKTFTIILEH